MFVCKNCGNKDPRYVGYIKGKPYCRKCILMLNENEEEMPIDNDVKGFDYVMPFTLSEEQKAISQKLVKHYFEKKNSFIEAVCGAGKTEIVFEVIKQCLKEKGKVGFAIPRKDVVIELETRFKESFKNSTIVSVYGSHHDILSADIILLTTHQLFRYRNYFDLLIVDEIDAFPFKNNDLLETMLNKAVKGVTIKMSATPDESEVEKYKKAGTYLSLHHRFHGHPLIVPQTKCIPFGKQWVVLYYLLHFKQQHKPVFVFAPTIIKAEKLFKFLKLFAPNGALVHSKELQRAQNIELFRKGEYQYLVTTSILERGVTVKDLQVIIFEAEHENYNKGTLIQMAGRVGRKIDAPNGEVIFIASYNTSSIKESIDKIKYENSM